RACNGSGVPISALDCIVAESKRLAREEESAEERLLRAQQEALRTQHEAQEALATLTRLHRQRQHLTIRGNEMIRRGLVSLDEPEEADRLESEAVVEAQGSDVLDTIDWNAVFG
ncbi:hypothetical protein QBC36DRAFT_164712, partial [Triangularia setosa]